MMNERRALFRQLQHYVETQLFGMYRWSDFKHRDPEKVVVERDPAGRRINQRSHGPYVEKVVSNFDGYMLVLLSPNECEPDRLPTGEMGQPKPAIVLYDGPPQPENIVVQGANRSETWAEITQQLRRNIEEGKSNGPQNRASW